MERDYFTGLVALLIEYGGKLQVSDASLCRAEMLVRKGDAKITATRHVFDDVLLLELEGKRGEDGEPSRSDAGAERADGALD